MAAVLCGVASEEFMRLENGHLFVSTKHDIILMNRIMGFQMSLKPMSGSSKSVSQELGPMTFTVLWRKLAVDTRNKNIKNKIVNIVLKLRNELSLSTSSSRK